MTHLLQVIVCTIFTIHARRKNSRAVATLKLAFPGKNPGDFVDFQAGKKLPAHTGGELQKTAYGRFSSV